MAVTVHHITTAKPDGFERWRAVPPAIAADISKGACQIDPAIRPLLPPGRQPKLFGRAVTALCMPPDFGAVLHAMDLVGKGDVLVIAAGGDSVTAMIGEILGGQLSRAGAAGLICDGAIRDVGELAGIAGFSVFTRHITPRGPSSWTDGVVNGPVMFGGRTINPGDLIIGDDDGLVSLTPGDMAACIDGSEKKLGLEAEWQTALSGGKSVAATFNLPKV
jgi:4-hydroxy-4-methyl-2-oxoglutarate aldolase